MTVINTNVKALFTQSALKVAGRDSQIAMEQLSTGKRINNSKDDAAGLAIAARMTQNIQGLSQSIRNAGDAISMIQTAEGATQEITVMLQRMSELAVQSANSTYSSDQRSYLDQEFQQLKQEIIRVSEMHEWNGFPILNGKAGIPVGLPTTITSARAGVAATGTGKALETGDLEIQTDKGSYAVPASVAAVDPKSNTIAAGSNNAGSAIAIAAAINSQVGITGVSAVAGAATIGATKTTVGSTSAQTDLYVNGEKVSLSLSSSHTLSQRRQYVMESINAGTAVHGVVAGDSGAGGLTLTTPDGRNLSVWYDSTSVQGSDFGLGLDTTPPSNPMGVTGVSGAAASAFGANEASEITFPSLGTGEGFTLNGMTFTSAATTTAKELAAAFSNLKSGMSALAAAAANPTAVTKGSFSGTFAEGFTTGSSNGANVVTATATSKGNVGDIITSPVLTVSTTPGAAAVAVAATTAGVSSTQAQVSTATFQALAFGQSVTFGGLTFTGGTGGATQDQVRAAFASIGTTSASTGQTFTQANTTAGGGIVSDTIGKFTSGTAITGGNFAAGVGNGTVTWTAAAGSNTQNTASLTISSTGTVVAPTTSTTQASTSSAPQIQRIAFVDLKAGESIKVSGLTFTSGTAGTTKEQLKAIFVQIGATANGAVKTFAEINTAVGNTLTSDAIGRFTFGSTGVDATTRGTYSSDTGPGEVKITSAVNDTAGNLTLNATGTAAAPTATVNTATTPTSVFAIGQASAPTSKSIETVTFQALGVGQSVTVNGLTFTPTVAMTNAQVAAAFSSVLTGETAAQVTARNTASALIGTYTGTNTAGYASTTVSSTNQVVYTSVNDAAASFGKPTAVGTPGKAPQPQVSTATFTALEAGASVTFAGLTFTSGTAGTTADQLKAAFAKVAGTSATTGQTFTQVNTTAGTDVSDAIGRFTSGTAITGGTFAAGGGTGQVTWTASTNSDTQIALASTGSMESTVVTFSALKTGQSFNLNGLGFTAKKDLTSAEVASAFASLTSGTSTTPANTANGNYSGSWAAGYSTAAASGATVKATATVAGTADIVFTSSRSVTTQGITVPASTVYGTVTLNSQNTFTIKPGAKAYATASAPAVDPTYANFTALGFEAKTINAKNIGRLNFQVGPAANQLISIDLADFGKNGDITGLITSDRAPTNLLTVNSSNDVIMNVNKSLDRIAATRATMGAVMNRLEHVISNLTNVVMNSEASRSQIEDADYAQASTELARTQIMQQAATAVLAQANTSQQTVLKLLQA
jgi:flagellin